MAPIASRLFTAGEVVFRFIPIIECCVTEEYKSLICDNCLKPSDELKCCSKCHQMFYCDKRCQTIDWRYHHKECLLFTRVGKQFVPKETTHLERLLLRLYLQMKSDKSFATNRQQLYEGLDVCLDDIEVDINVFKDSTDLMSEFSEICHHLDVFGVKYRRKEVMRLYVLIGRKLLSRLYYYTENPLDLDKTYFDLPMAFGLFIGMSYLSHSCTPNASLVTKGLSYEVRAMRAIPLGEAITLGVIDLAQNWSKRQRDVKMVYKFECNCDKCVQRVDKHFDYEKYNDLMAYHMKHWNVIDDMGVSEVVNKKYEMDSKLIQQMKEIYGERHTMVTRFLVMSFICFALYSDKANRVSLTHWYKQVEPNLRITHGTDHQLYHMFDKLAKDLGLIIG